jgi:hypothetical protein
MFGVPARRRNWKKWTVNSSSGLPRDLGVLAALGPPVAALLEGIEPTPIPRRVGATEIEQVRTAAQVFSSWDFTYGGGLAREAMLGQLRWSAGLLDAICPEELRPQLPPPSAISLAGPSTPVHMRTPIRC